MLHYILKAYIQALFIIMHTLLLFSLQSFRRWADIKSIVGHKRLFVVETSQAPRPIQFQFTDAEVAKYVRKMCVLQEKFFKEHMESCSENIRSGSSSSGGGGASSSNGTYTITQLDNMVR